MSATSILTKFTDQPSIQCLFFALNTWRGKEIIIQVLICFLPVFHVNLYNFFSIDIIIETPTYNLNIYFFLITNLKCKNIHPKKKNLQRKYCYHQKKKLTIKILYLYRSDNLNTRIFIKQNNKTIIYQCVPLLWNSLINLFMTAGILGY